MTENEFQTQGLEFLKRLNQKLVAQKIELQAHWDVDHICYRVSTLEKYEELKSSFVKMGDLLIESEVNGRPISTFKLHKSLEYDRYSIDVVELPAPKPNKFTAEGFEHVEVVCDLTFEKLKEKYSHCTLDFSGEDKNFNKELRISLGEISLKFHHLSLESVIRLEKNKTVFDALKKSEVLISLKDFEPVVVGTYPLGISTPESDIDVVLSGGSHLENKILENFKDYQNFKIETKNGELFSSFDFGGINFELYSDGKPSVEQRGFKHFLIEERLLKFGGPSFKQKIMSERKNGIKTEPAFAKVLDLPGDPFLALLDLYYLNIEELQQLFKGQQ